ncbi:MAG: hypothetical protein AB1512_20420 [Thermodesulfobacteriota bacterium]
MTRDNRRRLYAPVDRSHQYRFLALVLAYNVLIVIFLGLSLFLPDFLRIQDPDLSLEMRAAAAERILSMHTRVWPAVIALLCLIGMHSFRIFHRFVGPLFRFRWAFDQVRSGNLGFRVKLRRKDYLHKEEEGFNEMLQVLATRVGRIQTASLEAMRSLQEIGRQETEAIRERLTPLRRHLDELMEEAGGFRVEAEAPALPLDGEPAAEQAASEPSLEAVEPESRSSE